MDSFQKLLDFLDRLDANKIFFQLDRCRSETILVRVDLPGERWEVEFFADGHVEAEVFKSLESGIEGEEAWTRLFVENSDPTCAKRAD